MEKATIKLLSEYNSNINKLDISQKNINGILDLDKFTNLTKLVCVSNKISELVNLPNNLITLYCINNKISQLNNLPSSLVYLDCRVNKITELNNLPNSLVELFCGYNPITQLSSLPNQLKKLDCSSPLKRFYNAVHYKV